MRKLTAEQGYFSVLGGPPLPAEPGLVIVAHPLNGFALLDVYQPIPYFPVGVTAGASKRLLPPGTVAKVRIRAAVAPIPIGFPILFAVDNVSLAAGIPPGGAISVTDFTGFPDPTKPATGGLIGYLVGDVAAGDEYADVMLVSPTFAPLAAGSPATPGYTPTLPMPAFVEAGAYTIPSFTGAVPAMPNPPPGFVRILSTITYNSQDGASACLLGLPGLDFINMPAPPGSGASQYFQCPLAIGYNDMRPNIIASGGTCSASITYYDVPAIQNGVEVIIRPDPQPLYLTTVSQPMPASALYPTPQYAAPIVMPTDFVLNTVPDAGQKLPLSTVFVANTDTIAHNILLKTGTTFLFVTQVGVGAVLNLSNIPAFRTATGLWDTIALGEPIFTPGRNVGLFSTFAIRP